MAKFQINIEMFEKVQPKKTSNRTFLWKSVRQHGKPFNFIAKASQCVNGHERREDDTARSGYFNSLAGF